MPVNTIAFQCVKIRQLVFKRGGSSTEVLKKIKARTNKLQIIENLFMSYLQSQRPECCIESYYTTEKQKEIDCFCVERFCAIATKYSKPWVVISILPMSQKLSNPLGGGNAERTRKKIT